MSRRGNRRGNLGAVQLKLRRRRGDPMQAYDALPPDLRRWLAQAALPWSPSSCLAIWKKARTAQDAIDRLERAERAMLARFTGV